ncbi:MAG: sensor histidine kinase, partial [Rhodoferax sp.]
MRWTGISTTLALADTSPLGLAVARESLRMRAAQSIHSKWIVVIGALLTIVAVYDYAGWMHVLAWGVPVMVMAQVNEMVCRNVLKGLNDADAQGLALYQRHLWRMTVINQTLMGLTVWWMGSTTSMEIATLCTALQLVYLAGGMVNASTHPATFVTGAWINLLLAAAYWATHSTAGVAIAFGLLSVGWVVLKMSVQMAKGFLESLRMRFENLDLLDKLAHEKRIAEEATQFKSDFLSTISHEIRTPVSAILGMSYLTLKTDLSQRQREFVQIIQQGGQHLNGLINQVLDFSKVEANMLTLERVEFRLQTVL